MEFDKLFDKQTGTYIIYILDEHGGHGTFQRNVFDGHYQYWSACGDSMEVDQLRKIANKLRVLQSQEQS